MSMKLTENTIELPDVRQLVRDYAGSNLPATIITKHVMLMRRKLRKEILDSNNDADRAKAYAQYWEELKRVYIIERDLGEIARVLNDVNDVGAVDVSSLYNFLKRTALLNQMEIEAVHIKSVPWRRPTYEDFSGNNECGDYFDAWWPLIMIQLKDDPRAVLRGVKFVNLTSSTVIKEKDWHDEKAATGIAIARRIGEVPAHDAAVSGVNIQYIYIKDNPSNRTKTVFTFGVPQFARSFEIRVYPIIIESA